MGGLKPRRALRAMGGLKPRRGVGAVAKSGAKVGARRVEARVETREGPAEAPGPKEPRFEYAQDRARRQSRQAKKGPSESTP